MSVNDRPEPREDFPLDTTAKLEAAFDPTDVDDIVIPVRIVQGDAPRELQDHRFFNVPVVPGKRVTVVGGNKNRRRLYIRNTHAADTVYLFDGNAQQAFLGFPLPFGVFVEVYSEAPVYAELPTGGANAVILAVLDEFTVEENE